MRLWSGWCLMVSLGLSACNTDSFAGIDTGLTGVVMRGPMTPVCQTDIPCSAPFSAGFAVWQGSRLVASFRSDTLGHFTVALAPGQYRLVPGSDAPIIAPESQAKTVDVGPRELTTVRLDFDTGLR
jgi:hypothetical protein